MADPLQVVEKESEQDEHLISSAERDDVEVDKEEGGEEEDHDYDDDDDYDSDENDNDNANNDNNMELTEEERDWAIRIKEIMNSDPELSEKSSSISDMMIAQIALVSMADEELGLYDNANNDDHDPVEKVKHRIRGIQRVHNAFEITESLEEAKSLMTRWVQDLAPGFLLGFEERNGSFANVLDLTNFNMSILADEDKHLLIMKGWYYLYQCQNQHFAATRNGMISMCEVQGYYWHSKTMASVRAFQAWAELASGYPLHFTSIMHFHTGMFINLATSIAKRLIPKGVAQKFHFGAQSDQRLNEIYLQPTLEKANQRLIQKLHQALETRFYNEKHFRLKVDDHDDDNGE